jgi:riboflavin transporter FmnP
MNSKEVALCSVFTALGIMLERIRIPTLPGQVQFYFWEIPVVIALLLFGFRLGFSVAVLTAFGQALIFPRALGFLFPIWNLIAMLTTLIGVYVGQRLVKWRVSRTSQANMLKIKPVLYLVSLAIVFRLSLMPFVNYFMYRFMMPIFVGRSFSDAFIMALMPGLLAYDAIIMLYTVPTSYIIAKMINKNLNIGNQLF